MLSLTEEDVRRALDPVQLISAIEAAFRDRYPSIVLPERTIVPNATGIFLSMSCYDRSANAFGLKLVQVRDRSLPDIPGGRVQATYLLLDPETAQPRLTVSANYLTDLRTAATSAVATSLLASPDASTLGIFGTGRLARAHLRVIPLVRTIRRVLVCGSDPSRSKSFADQTRFENPALTIEAADPHACAIESDVLCCCTSSPSPLFDGRDLRPGTHLNLVGAFQPHTRESDTHTIQNARVVVDTYESVQSEMGDLVIPMKEGAISSDHVIANLHELVGGKKKGRTAPEEITLFKSVGCALEDMVAAELLLATR